jgi:hypothetical protein
MDLNHQFDFEYSSEISVYRDGMLINRFDRYICVVCGIFKGINYTQAGEVYSIILYSYDDNHENMSCGEFLARNIL